MIFICHSSKDQKVATTICGTLEREGFTSWISTRDIGPGENFQEAIYGAIRSATAMVLVFTASANVSDEVKKEIGLAGQFRLSVIPIRVENVIPNDALAYELVTRQWINWFEDREQALERLLLQLSKNGEKRIQTSPRPKSKEPGQAKIAEKVTQILPTMKPRLPRGVRLTHNEAQGGWVLLAPERVFKADAIAHEIIKRCTGEATVAEIVDDLTKTFNAPRDRIETDVTAMLTGLVDKRLMEVA
jgi:pyrroloquinoline quinone biosynthesis protein D